MLCLRPVSSYHAEQEAQKIQERNEQKRKVPRTVLLHNAEELDNDLGAGSDQNLTLARLLGVVDGVERIVEDGCLNHFDGRRFSNRGNGK